MKITVSFDVDIDTDAWKAHRHCTDDDIRRQVQRDVQRTTENHYDSLGLLR